MNETQNVQVAKPLQPYSAFRIINFYISLNKSSELEALEDVEWLENKTMIGPLETLTSLTPSSNSTNAEASTSTILDSSLQPQTSSTGTSTPEVASETLSRTPVSSSLISEAKQSSTILINNLTQSVSDSAISHNSSKASNSSKTTKQRVHVAKTTYSAVRVSQKGHKGHKNESHTQNHIFDPHSIYSNHQVHDRYVTIIFIND